MFFCFLSNQENLYLIHRNSDLFYGIYNTVNEHNQRWNHYLLSFICFIIAHDFYFITLWWHYTLFINILRRNKVNCYYNLIFHISDFPKLFMMTFKYGLMKSRYSLIDRLLFLSLVLYLYKNYLFLLASNNLLCQVGS